MAGYKYKHSQAFRAVWYSSCLTVVLGMVAWEQVPSNKCVNIGDPVTFKCALSGLTDIFPLWRQLTGTIRTVSDGLQVDLNVCSTCSILNETQGEYFLHISTVNAADAGTWSCSQFGVTPGSQEADLTILDSCSVSISVSGATEDQPKTYTCMSEDTIELSCNLTDCGPSCVDTTWYNGSEVLSTDQTLTLTTFPHHNGTVIYCSAYTGDNVLVSSDSIILNIEFAPFSAELVIKADDCPPRYGCDVFANPHPFTSFPKQDFNGSEVKVDRGQPVFCIAENEYGSVSSENIKVPFCLYTGEKIGIGVGVVIIIIIIVLGITVRYAIKKKLPCQKVCDSNTKGKEARKNDSVEVEKA